MVTRRVRVVAAGMALALGGVVGCSDDAEVVSDDGPSPEKALAAAVERTFEGSGRFTLEFDDDDAADWTMEGEFSGDDVRMTITSDDGTAYETLVIDDVLYTSASSAGFFADVPDGIEWLSEEMGESDGWSDMALSDPSAGIGFQEVPELLETVSEVVDDGTEVVDGVEHRRLKATVPGTALLDEQGLDEREDAEAEADADGVDAEEQARFDRIDRYVMEHLSVDVSVLLDPSGKLRRATLAANTDIEDEYRSCLYLFGVTSDSTTTLEIEALDAGEALTAPDPATVSTWEVVMGLGSPSAEDGDDPLLQTSDGELHRSELEFSLGLASMFTGLDAASLEGLSDEELVARYDEFVAADPFEMLEDGPLGDLLGEMEGFEDDLFEGCPA